MIACCPTLNVLLENTVYQFYNIDGAYTQVYTFQGFSGGMYYWVDTTGTRAIWYMESGSIYYWLIGNQIHLGTWTCFMYSSINTVEKKCPNYEGYDLNWHFWDNQDSSFIATNDVSVNCAND